MRCEGTANAVEGFTWFDDGRHIVEAANGSDNSSHCANARNNYRRVGIATGLSKELEKRSLNSSVLLESQQRSVEHLGGGLIEWLRNAVAVSSQGNENLGNLEKRRAVNSWPFFFRYPTHRHGHVPPLCLLHHASQQRHDAATCGNRCSRRRIRHRKALETMARVYYRSGAVTGSAESSHGALDPSVARLRRGI